jgi:hypothetical protein
MLTTYDRVMQAYKRKVRLEAALCARESDRRDQREVWTWVRFRPGKPLAVALFSLTLLGGCASAVTRDPWQAETVRAEQLPVQP